MKNLTPENIAKACGGTYVPGKTEVSGGGTGADENEAKLTGDAGYTKDFEVTAVTADSRKVTPGCLFAPIRGERADGHDFISEVMKKGAALTLTERAEAAKGYPYILVHSTPKALQDLARFYLKSLAIPVVSVTGSVGKTSTKEMIASVLSQKYRTLKTLGNFNNDLGLPFTIFRLTDEDQIAVLEMGISHFGEMSVLASIAPPDVCVITNIGTCHLEFLGDRDGVFKAKTESFDYLKADGYAVLNGDDDKLCKVKEVNGKEPVFFGLDSKHNIYADAIEPLGLKGIRFTIHMYGRSFPVTLPVPGRHMVMNALAGAACGYIFHETDEEIKAGIESIKPLSGRFHIIESKGITVIDDCYNANPMSMKASLSILGDASGRKVAILGDMGELGADERELHKEVGKFLADHSIDLLITAGPLAKLLSNEAVKRNPVLEAVPYDDTEKLDAGFLKLIKKGDTVLVKASHFMHFEKLVESLTQASDFQ